MAVTFASWCRAALRASGGRVLCLRPPRMAPEAVSRPFLRFFVPQAWPAACPRVGGETLPLTPAGLHVLGPGVRCLLASHLTPQSLSLPIPNRSVSRSPRRLGGRRIGVQRHQAPLDAARHLCDVVGGLTREPSWRSLAGKGERARGCPAVPRLVRAGRAAGAQSQRRDTQPRPSSVGGRASCCSAAQL